MFHGTNRPKVDFIFQFFHVITGCRQSYIQHNIIEIVIACFRIVIFESIRINHISDLYIIRFFIRVISFFNTVTVSRKYKFGFTRREIGLLETEAGKVPALDAEITRLKGELKVFQDKADADDAAARKKLLDDAENDGRIDAATRPIYENLLAKDRENGEKALEKLSPKRSVMTDLRVNPTGESPWNKRMSEIKDKLNHK